MDSGGLYGGRAGHDSQDELAAIAACVAYRTHSTS